MPAVILACVGLAALLGAADRLLAAAACRHIARRAERSLGAGTSAVARIVSVPFVTQAITGVYRDVRLTAPACTIGGIELRGLTVKLSGVRASVRQIVAARRPVADGAPARGPSANGVRVLARTFTADHVEASATIPFPVLAARLPAGLELRRSGYDIGISGWLGLMPVAGALAVAAGGQGISVIPKMLGVTGLVGFVIALPGLPPEVVVSGLRVTEAGLEVMAKGDEVILGPR